MQLDTKSLDVDVAKPPRFHGWLEVKRMKKNRLAKVRKAPRADMPPRKMDG